MVEGSIRRSADRIRITAQLIRAADGFHLWSQTYDRSLDDVFAAQTDIAENIARALGVLLDDRKRALMADAGVNDVEAFLAFQRGAVLFDAAHNDAPQIETLQRANAEFEIAIARQSKFAQAHFMHHDLYAHVLMDELIGDNANSVSVAGFSKDEALKRLAADLDAAAEFETDPGQRLVIRAVRTFLSDDWRGLGTKMDRAFAGWENCRNGAWMARMGPPFGRAAEVYRRARERTRCDPLVEIPWFDAALAAIALGRAEEALKLADEAEALGLGGDLSSARVDALLALGRHDEAARVLAKAAIVEPEQLVKAPAAAGLKSETEAALAAFHAEGDIHRELIAHAVAGDRAGANRIAASIDSRPLGAAILTRAASFCFCGAPFDLSATPNFARRLDEGDLPWPPESPIKWPLKDW